MKQTKKNSSWFIKFYFLKKKLTKYAQMSIYLGAKNENTKQKM